VVDDLTQLKVELARIEKDIAGFEKAIQSAMVMLERKKTIDYGRMRDYGQSAFLLRVVFDEWNTEEMEAVFHKVKGIFEARRALRREQQRLILQVEASEVPQQYMKAEMMESTFRGGGDL